MTATGSALTPIDYAERWRQMVEERRVFMDALYDRVGRTTENYWESRSAFFRPSVQRQTGSDPFLARVLDLVTEETTVLDVGAGGGRYAIPIAARAREVVAVEPAAAMVRVLREEAAAAGVRNLRIVDSDWLDAEVAPADVAICSHVIYPIADIVPFLEKLNSHALRRCLLYLNAGQPPWENPDLWRRFHGEPMRPQPEAIDAYNLLHQMGIHADVEIVTLQRRSSMGAPTIADAAAQFRDRLILDDRPETTSALETVLREMLVHTDEGWSLPPRPALAAIISWPPSSAVRGARTAR